MKRGSKSSEKSAQKGEVKKIAEKIQKFTPGG